MAPIPLISVCIPVYNGEQHIQETIESVQKQTFSDFELLIQDNASTDATWELLVRLAAQDPRISLARNPNNLGMSGNWNAVIDRAQGKYVMLLSADDLLLPNFLRDCLAEFEREPVDAVTANHLYLEEGKTRKRNVRVKAGTYRDFVNKVMLFNPFSINFTLFSRTALDRLRVNRRVFARSLYTCDYDLWLRAAGAGMAVSYLEEPLALYRVHTSNLSKQRIRMNKHTFLTLAAIKQLRKQHGLAYRFTVFRLFARHLAIAIRGSAVNKRLLACQLAEILG